MIRRALLASSTVLGLLVPLAVATAPAAHAGGTCHTDATAARGDRVALARLCFQPATLFVEPGTRVTFTNADELVHNVTAHGFQWGDPGPLGPGDTVAASFADPGVYAYSCTIHPGMVGAVVVGDPAQALQAGAPRAPAAATPTAAVATALAADTRAVGAAGGDGLGTGSAALLAAGAGLVGAVAVLAGQRFRARRRSAR